MANVGAETLISGGLVEGRVENKLREITGRRYIHLCGSGTAAIMFALRGMHVPRGSEVLMPALLCVNPGSATVYAGCKPTFCDVEKKTYNISLSSLEDSITLRTKCIIAVHEHGEPCDIEGVTDIAQEHKIPVIEDSAKTLGVELGSGYAGGFGDVSVLSFGRGKPIEIEGGGGAVATDDPHLSGRLERLIKAHSYNDVDEGVFYKVQRALFFAARDASLTDPRVLKQYGRFVEVFRNWYIKSPKGLQWGSLENELDNINENIEARRRAAALFKKIITGSPAETPGYTGRGSYVRYPVLVGNSVTLGPRLRKLGFDSNELIPPVNNMFNPEDPLSTFSNSEYLYKRQLILWAYSNTEMVKKCAEIVKEFATPPS
jgi:dTDP-4-amino-4,6-dideoxygalactose transaminase